MLHTCGREPNEDNRILGNCDGCYMTAYGDGRLNGMERVAEELLAHLTDAVKIEFNPLNSTKESDANAEWETGRRILSLIEGTRKFAKTRHSIESAEHFRRRRCFRGRG